MDVNMAPPSDLLMSTFRGKTDPDAAVYKKCLELSRFKERFPTQVEEGRRLQEEASQEAISLQGDLCLSWCGPMWDQEDSGYRTPTGAKVKLPQA